MTCVAMDIFFKEKINGDEDKLLSKLISRTNDIHSNVEFTDVCDTFTDVLMIQLSRFKESNDIAWKFMTLGNICCSSYLDFKKNNSDVKFFDYTAKSGKVKAVLVVRFIKDKDGLLFCTIMNEIVEHNFALGEIYFLEKFDSVLQIVDELTAIFEERSNGSKSVSVFGKFKNVLVWEIEKFDVSGDGAWKFITFGNVCCEDYAVFKSNNSGIEFIDSTAVSGNICSLLEVTFVKIEKDGVIYCGIHNIEDELSEKDKIAIFATHCN